MVSGPYCRSKRCATFFLLSAHLMHSALVCGWSSSMTLFELIVVDPSDPIFNPVWRQGAYALPFATRLGVTPSVYLWSIGASTLNISSLWFFESVSISHLILSGLLALSAFWHWAYCDLDLFVQSSSGHIVLDLVKVFGIHLLLASIISFGFGSLHLSGVFWPRYVDFRLLGSSRFSSFC